MQFWYKIAPAVLLTLGTASAAGPYDNPLAHAVRSGEISADDSSETPKLFEPRDRMVRWNNVMRTDQPCPFYEAWRTKPVDTAATPHKMELVFRKPYNVGTLLAFGDGRDAAFTVSPGTANGDSVVTAYFDAPVSRIAFTATRIVPATVVNWGSRRDAPETLISYNFGLLGLYSVPGRRENIAPFAAARASGLKVRQKAEAARVLAGGANDASAYTMWRSQDLKPGEAAELVLAFPAPVSANEIALWFDSDSWGGMPAKVEVLADGSPLGEITGFSNHPHTGHHLYLLKNPTPKTRFSELKFRFFPREKQRNVEITEIVVLGEPGANPVAARSGTAFRKTIPIRAKDMEFVSARIERADGTVVRNLEPVEGGPVFRLGWDGLDESGKAAAPGRYTVRGAARKTLRAAYESTPYSPVSTPWVTPSRKGGWLSDHNPATTLERFGDSLWVGSPLAESGDTIMELDFAGRKRWGVRWLNLAGAGVIREAAGQLYVACAGGWMGPKIVVTRLDPKTKKFETLLNLPFPPEYKARNGHDVKVAFGFAANDSVMAVALEKVGNIRLFGLDGKFQKEFKVAAPGAMRFNADGELIAISGNRLISLDPNTGVETPLISAGLVAPRDFSFAPGGGWWVADAGANQVKRFDANGKLVRTVGSGQPRKPGKFAVDAIHAPLSALELPNGELWVAEGGVMPKRISVWNASTGAFVRDYVGAARYEAGGWLDPADPDTFYAEGMTFRKRNGKWTLDAIYWDGDHPDMKKLTARSLLPERPLRVRGKLFLGRDRHWCPSSIFYGEMMPDGALRLHAALGEGSDKGTTFLWVDRNRDGKMDASETLTVPGEFTVLQWGSRLGDNLEFYFIRNRNELCKLAPVWKDGLPDYDWKNLRTIGKIPGHTISLAPLPDGGVLVNCGPRMLCIDEKTGKTRWSYANAYPSNSHDSPLPKPGDIQHTLHVEGAVEIPRFGAVFMLNSNKGLRHLFRTDGLYLGKLFDDQRLAAPLAFDGVKPGDDLARYSLMDEAFLGSFARCADGKIRFAGGKNHHSISEVRNLETLREFTLPLEFTPDDARNAAESRAREIARRRDGVARPNLTLGNSADWNRIPAVTMTDGGEKRFTVRLAATPTEFCGKFEVPDSSPFVNTGDDPKLLFKTGDSVNVELGGHCSGPVAPGDVRLLIAPFKGKNTAVLYRYKVPNFKGKAVEFISPIGKVSVDAVTVLDDAKIDVHRNPSGYTVEFRIPSAHFPALEGRELYGDAGVIFSDPAGDRNAYNVFYNSAAKGVTADVPSEIRLQPKFWGKIQK